MLSCCNLVYANRTEENMFQCPQPKASFTFCREHLESADRQRQFWSCIVTFPCPNLSPLWATKAFGKPSKREQWRQEWVTGWNRQPYYFAVKENLTLNNQTLCFLFKQRAYSNSQNLRDNKVVSNLNLVKYEKIMVLMVLAAPGETGSKLQLATIQTPQCSKFSDNEKSSCSYGDVSGHYWFFYVAVTKLILSLKRWAQTNMKI